MNKRLAVALAMLAMTVGIGGGGGAVHVPEPEGFPTGKRSGAGTEYKPKPMSPARRAAKAYAREMNAKVPHRWRLKPKKTSKR